MAGGGSKWHPLHAALVLGHEEKVKKVFLDGGEDPKMLELRNGSGWGALHFASQSGSPKLVEWLLGLGCNSGSCTAKGETALHLAAARGDERICNLLLEGGAPAGVTTREGRTALHAAAEQGHLAVAKLLVSKGGISPATTDANRMSAAALAKTNKHKAMVAFFLRSCPSAHTTLKPGVACGGGVGGLWQGGKAGSLVRGLSALRKEEVGGTRRKRGLGQAGSRAGNWHGAAGHNGLPSPSDMHGSGAAPGAGRGGGYDFLKAARDGDTAALGRILHCGEVGVDWVGGSNGWTAVMEAAAHGCREAVCYLVDRGADLEQANKKGMTPLQLAVRSGHLAVVEELLARGANPGGMTKSGLCLRCVAASAGHDFLTDWLYTMGIAKGAGGDQSCACGGSEGAASTRGPGGGSEGSGAGGGGGGGGGVTWGVTWGGGWPRWDWSSTRNA